MRQEDVAKKPAKAIGEALGFRDCFRLSISRQHDGPLTIEAECFARDNVLNALTGETVTRRMVLIDADEHTQVIT